MQKHFRLRHISLPPPPYGPSIRALNLNVRRAPYITADSEHSCTRYTSDGQTGFYF